MSIVGLLLYARQTSYDLNTGFELLIYLVGFQNPRLIIMIYCLDKNGTNKTLPASPRPVDSLAKILWSGFINYAMLRQ